MYGFDESIPIGKRIGYLRKQTKMSQKDFARYLKMSPRTLQCWEQGSRVPPSCMADWIQRILIAENMIDCPGPNDIITPEMVEALAHRRAGSL